MKTLIQSLTASAVGLASAGCIPMTPPPQPDANLRVVHASPDAPAVDVCANGDVLFAEAAFPAATDYVAVPDGTYDVKVIPADAGCDADGVIEAELPLQGNTDTTVVAIDLLADIRPLVLADDNTAPAMGEARVRFVHASPDAPTVDITLTDGTTLFDNVSFGESGGYIAVAEGTYDLDVRDETGMQVVLTLEDVELEAGDVYTVFAVGLLEGEPALDALITLDN